MAQEWAIPLYKSAAWRRAREAYMNAPVDTPYGVVPPRMCERCRAKGVLRPAKVVHHKIHLTPQNVGDPAVALDPRNFQRLCQDCHAAVHSGRPDAPRVVFDASGNVVGREDGWQEETRR